MASRRLKERRAQFQQYKKDVDERGKPFFPYAMFHDTIMSFVVVGVIIALTCIWKWTIPGDHTSTEAGWLGPLYAEEAQPGTINFVPRPDWYFYFLFYLLRIFKWPDSVILGTIGIPTILLMVMIALPFVDLRRERRLSRRPVAVVAAVLVAVSMGVLTYKGATAKESLPAENLALVSTWAERQGFTGNQTAIEGAKVFAQVGCQTCHTYLGAGSSNLGAPDLSAQGTKMNAKQLQEYIADPSKFGNNVMPKFETLGPTLLRQLAVFLEASKGPK